MPGLSHVPSSGFHLTTLTASSRPPSALNTYIPPSQTAPFSKESNQCATDNGPISEQVWRCPPAVSQRRATNCRRHATCCADAISSLRHRRHPSPVSQRQPGPGVSRFDKRRLRDWDSLSSSDPSALNKSSARERRDIAVIRQKSAKSRAPRPPQFR